MVSSTSEMNSSCEYFLFGGLFSWIFGLSRIPLFVSLQRISSSTKNASR